MKRPDTNRQMQRGREGRGDILWGERSWEDGLHDVPGATNRVVCLGQRA